MLEPLGGKVQNKFNPTLEISTIHGEFHSHGKDVVRAG